VSEFCGSVHVGSVVNSDVTSDSPRRIDSLGSFLKKESIQKIRSLQIDSLQINKCVQIDPGCVVEHLLR